MCTRCSVVRVEGDAMVHAEHPAVARVEHMPALAIGIVDNGIEQGHPSQRVMVV